MISKRPLTFAEILLAESSIDFPGLQIKEQIDAIKNERSWETACQKSEELLPKLYAELHSRHLERKQLVMVQRLQKTPNRDEKISAEPFRAALCLSGGGIRSATFNLGVLQGLARHGLLNKFSYLSTVSGGGFIGGWLSAWIHRSSGGVDDVSKQLFAPCKDPLQPEPAAISNLRVFSNYLTPKKGLLSIDTWDLMAVYVRNLVLNWLVFIPVLVAFLMLPRVSIAVMKSSHLSADFCWWTGFIFGGIALTYLGLNLPSTNLFNAGLKRFLVFFLIPLVLSALSLSAYWVRFTGDAPKPQIFIKASFVFALLPLLAFLIGRGVAAVNNRGKPASSQSPPRTFLTLLKYFGALVLTLVAFALTGLVIWFVVTHKPYFPLRIDQSGARLYTTFGMPALLLIMAFGGTLIAGLTSAFTNTQDQEWWARAGAWMCIVVVGWIVIHALVLFGPSVFADLQSRVVDLNNWNLKTLSGVVVTITGFISGAITLAGSFSGATPAHEGKNGETQGGGSKRTWVISIAAIVFLGFIAILLSLVSNWLMASELGQWLSAKLVGTRRIIPLNDPRDILYSSSGRVVLVVMTAFAFVGFLFGLAINTNRFSLHGYWRNRLMRAYLGASNPRHDEDENRFTEFNANDDLHMHELQNQRPLHVINLTLNLVGGKRLEWQDRKAESLSVTPLHVGSFWLGYRPAKDYAKGISLATAVAISGAAASPNMGYMMTSPVVRFLMTLFNIRLGAWLGNPGEAGGGDESKAMKPAYVNDSPTQSVRPIVSEALGMTDSNSPYVYLSDGGHFENLGLYEMVLRRCPLIVVSDSSTDTDYDLDCLAMAIRQIRIDFGVPIDMGLLNFGPGADRSRNYCAVGKIRYSCMDNETGDATKDADYDGILIYLKPSLLGDEPRDILTYALSHPAFPEEPISDQWFSEAQFESYRALGNRMIEKICSESCNQSDPALYQFAEQAAAHAKRQVRP